MDYDYSRSIPPSTVERVAAAPRLGALPGRVERPRDSASAGRDAGGGESVAQAGARRRGPKRAGEGGVQALVHRMPPGRVSRLSAEQKAELVRLLEQGAEAH